MKKIECIDAVIKLYTVSQLVDDEFGDGNLSADLRNCADRLHVLTVGVRIAEAETNITIQKAKE